MKPFCVFCVFRGPFLREATTALLVALLLLQSATAVAPGPAWWGTKSVTDSFAVPDDFAVANIGQLKYMARKAMLAMDAELPGGAGETIHLLVDPWGNTLETATKPENGLAINVGQLKHVATPFYQRLGLPYPWAGGSAVRDDYLLVNLGQLKHVFSFELKFRTFGVVTAVEIPEAIKLAAQAQWVANMPLGSTEDDFDGDGIPNLQEYLMHPTLPLFDTNDYDGDRISNDDEQNHSNGVLNMLNFADAVWDHDADGAVEYNDVNWNTQHYGDGVMNFEEVLLELSLSSATTSTRTDGLSDAEVLVWTLNADAPLEPSVDPLRMFWEDIDDGWLGTNVGLSHSDSFAAWLDDADMNGNQIADGLEAFRTEVLDTLLWWPQNPGISEIEYPGLAYDAEGNLIDLDGDGALDSDRDYDGLPDLWEYRYELNLRVNDAGEDPDNDDLSNAEEYEHGTNPRLADSDGDGFDDGVEVHSEGGDPLDSTVGLPLTLEVVSLLYQTVSAGGVSAPLMVKVTQGGQPVLGAAVEFATSSGSGTLRATTSAATGAQMTVTTGSNGIASAVYLAEATPGSAGVTATLSGGGGSQSLSFNLYIVAGSEGTGGAGGDGPVRPWANITSDENVPDWEDAKVVEQPVALFEQSKRVSNDWFGGYAAPSSYASWFDYAGHEDSESYQGAKPVWEDKFGMLIYPEPSTSPYNYYNTDFSHQAHAELREYQGGGVGGTVIGYASISHSRVGLASNPTQPPQPWMVCRKFFTYRKTLPSPNPGTVAPVFSALDVVPLFIQPGMNRTMTNAAAPQTFRCLQMEPEPTMGFWTRQYVGRVTATPFDDEGLALDATGQEVWVTLPAGGEGVQMLMQSPVDLDSVTYKVQGGDVTPPVSTSLFSNWWFYYESYSGTTPGTNSALHPAMNDGAGNLTVSARPLLKFDVKPRHNITITIQPIGLVSGTTTLHPQNVPDAAELKTYLDSVFGPQVNVYTTINPVRAQVNVAFDVGLGAGYGNLGRREDGVTGDGRLSILQGRHDKIGVYSAEETAILQTPGASPDPDAAITIYWVAGGRMDDFEWKDAEAELAGTVNGLQPMSLRGYAGKAMKSLMSDINPGPRVIWITGFGQQQPSMHWIVAHELGHALGDIGHTTEKYQIVNGLKQQKPGGGNTGFSLYSDNTLRLMTSMDGPHRASGPKQLNKYERDRIADFDDYD